MEVRSLTFFVVIFQERKYQNKKERMNHVICGLPHWKRREKTAGKLAGKQANVTTEQFLQLLSSSAWLCIFWIYIDNNKKDREWERKWESHHFLRSYKIQPSLLTSVF